MQRCRLPSQGLYPIVPSSSDEDESGSFSSSSQSQSHDGALRPTKSDWSFPTPRLEARSRSENLSSMNSKIHNGFHNDSALVREQQMILEQIQRDQERKKKKQSREEEQGSVYGLTNKPPLTTLESSSSLPPRLLREEEIFKPFARDATAEPALSGRLWDAEVEPPVPSSSSSVPPLTSEDVDCRSYRSCGDISRLKETELQFIEEQRRIWEQIQKDKEQKTQVAALTAKDSYEATRTQTKSPPTRRIRLSNFDAPRDSARRLQQQRGEQGCILPSPLLFLPTESLDTEDVDDLLLDPVNPAPTMTTDLLRHDSTNDRQQRRTTNTNTNDQGDVVVRQFTNGQKVKVRGTERAETAVANGTAILFVCPNCQHTFRISDKTNNVYCKYCKQVSPVNRGPSSVVRRS